MITKINLDTSLPVSGLVLAAGEGTRMRPLSDERPKALIPTLDLPQMSWQIASLVRAGVENLWVNSHFHAPQIEKEVGRVNEVLDQSVGLSFEEGIPLGTAGALRKLSDVLGETFVVVNSDIACDLPLERLIAAHSSSKAPITLVAIPSDDQADLVLEEGWVRELVDRNDKWRAGHIYGGIGVFEREVLRFIPEGPSGLFETVFVRSIEQQLPIAALEWEGYWRDVGNPASHLRVNLDALSGEFDRRSILGPLRSVPIRDDGLAYVGEEAVIDEVELRHCIVGRGAIIEPGSRLERCVVWDSARVPAGEYRNSILTGASLVEVD